MSALWTFTDHVCQTRKAQLSQWTSLDQIVSAIEQCPIQPLWWEPARASHLADCHRASFVLEVGGDLYDGFFNSPVGYRGQYAISEQCGEAANRTLIYSLHPRLMRVVDSQSKATTRDVESSLNGVQAKVWIVESEVNEQLGDPEPSIIFAQWEFFAPNGQGLRAPIGGLLEVKGSWIDASGAVVLNPEKRERSRHIYETGDSN